MDQEDKIVQSFANEYSANPYIWPHLAIINDNHKSVKEFLNYPDVDVNYKTKNGFSPFHVACIYGSEYIVQLLLQDERVNINDKTYDRKSDPALSANEDLSFFYIPFTDQMNGFLLACYFCRLNILQLLMKDERIYVQTVDKNLQTGFHIACEFGNVELAKLLLDDGRINPNAKDDQGETGFMLACKHNYVDLIKMLLEIDTINISLSNNSSRNGLLIACMYNSFETVKLLINDSRFDLNVKDITGRTLLMLAKDDKVFELLLDHCSNINETDNDGRNVFHHACLSESFKIIRILIKDTTVNFRCVDKKGQTPLHTICSVNFYWDSESLCSMIDFLIEYDLVDINAKDFEGRIALHLACEIGPLEAVKKLLNYSDISSEDNNGYTPLYYACSGQHYEIIDYLLKDTPMYLKKDRKNYD